MYILSLMICDLHNTWSPSTTRTARLKAIVRPCAPTTWSGSSNHPKFPGSCGCGCRRLHVDTWMVFVRENAIHNRWWLGVALFQETSFDPLVGGLVAMFYCSTFFFQRGGSTCWQDMARYRWTPQWTGRMGQNLQKMRWISSCIKHFDVNNKAFSEVLSHTTWFFSSHES